ncbi:YIF1-domain-containing protein [Sphaerosporella brunnea]|uniref:Protein YIF1 n=1 Tax=Sphaerosporella brunnea TaxID=1250544 RepID=A0A5J5EVX4_9PEZI|nr:YIF1-domain-containing protein [Sphaerosporella brunnea]
MYGQNVTPPIHHPVPKRPVQVPVMQSPPPPPQSSDPYDNPYGGHATAAYPQQGQPNAYAQFGNFPQGGGGFFTDPTTAQMGFNVARAAMSGGTDLAEKNITHYFSSLKPYFAVTNVYVARKLMIILNPWRHVSWSRQSAVRASAQHPGEAETIYLPPREDVNAPDMYIPLMSFVTYILLSALLYGLSGTFYPEILGYTSSSALGAVVFELVGLRLGCYFLGIGNSQLLDLVAYSGYKFVGVIVSILATTVLGRGWLSWIVFAYVCGAQAFFMLRSLKYALLQDTDGSGDAQIVYMTAPRTQRKRRSWFLFGYSYLVQFLMMLMLTSGIGKSKVKV